MDPSPNNATSPVDEEDAWDTDGFVIPSLSVGASELSSSHAAGVANPNPLSRPMKVEKIYLGPHGTPPALAKQQDPGNRLRSKNKPREADRRVAGAGRGTKAEALRGEPPTAAAAAAMSKTSPRGRANPH